MFQVATFSPKACSLDGGRRVEAYRFVEGPASGCAPQDVVRLVQDAGEIDVEETLVELGLKVDIAQRDVGLVALRVDHEPLLQRIGARVEEQRDARGAAEGGLVLQRDA